MSNLLERQTCFNFKKVGLQVIANSLHGQLFLDLWTINSVRTLNCITQFKTYTPNLL